MQFPSSVHDLRREHYAIAGIPTYLHTDWNAYTQIPPKGALCATIGRINAGEVEFFVGDGVHPYTALGKFGTSMDAVSSALALKADTAAVSSALALLKAIDAAANAKLEDTLNNYNSTGLSRGSLTSYAIEATVPKDCMLGGAYVVYGGMSITNEISEDIDDWGGLECVNTKTADIISNVGSGEGATPTMTQETAVIWEADKTFYVRAKFRVTNEVCTSVDFVFHGGKEVTSALQASPTINQWYTVSKVVSLPNGTPDTPVVIGLRHYYADGTAATDATLEVDMSEMVVVNLTAIGLNSMTVEQVDALVAEGAFAGAKDSVAMRLKSTDGSGGNPSYIYHEPVTLRRLASGVRDTVENGMLIRRVKEDGSGQLAEPIVVPGIGSGILAVFPGGKIKKEPALKDVAAYTASGFAISRTGFPIKTIESIGKIDPDTGAVHSIANGTAVVAENGLSFTHPDLVAGDIVELVYLWDYQGPVGENTYNYLKDPLVGYDESNSKYYRAVPTYNSGGTLTWTTSEV